jgi:ornithine cyclodeaminase/alanine dehydrogenase-like protein (mu-crystallin family)
MINILVKGNRWTQRSLRDKNYNGCSLGQLSDANSGYPLMISEMSLLAARRTVATGNKPSIGYRVSVNT